MYTFIYEKSIITARNRMLREGIVFSLFVSPRGDTPISGPRSFPRGVTSLWSQVLFRGGVSQSLFSGPFQGIPQPAQGVSLSPLIRTRTGVHPYLSPSQNQDRGYTLRPGPGQGYPPPLASTRTGVTPLPPGQDHDRGTLPTRTSTGVTPSASPPGQDTLREVRLLRSRRRTFFFKSIFGR